MVKVALCQIFLSVKLSVLLHGVKLSYNPSNEAINLDSCFYDMMYVLEPYAPPKLDAPKSPWLSSPAALWFCAQAVRSSSSSSRSPRSARARLPSVDFTLRTHAHPWASQTNRVNSCWQVRGGVRRVDVGGGEGGLRRDRVGMEVEEKVKHCHLQDIQFSFH